jgi:hypothetical protein
MDRCEIAEGGEEAPVIVREGEEEGESEGLSEREKC